MMMMILDHTQSVIIGLSLVLKFVREPIYSFVYCDIVMFIFRRFRLKLPSHASFKAEGIFLPNMVTHCSNSQENHPCAETRRLSHKA